MTPRVLFISRARAEEMRPPRRSAIISIVDTDKHPAALKAGWHAVLRLSFDDLDPDSFPAEFGMDLGGDNMIRMSAEQAEQVAAFIREVTRESPRIVVHCRHGVSRTAGVAKAVSEFLGAFFPPSHDEYNVYVHRITKTALSAR